MGLATTLAVVGVATAAGGLYQQQKASGQVKDANAAVTAASIKAENIRQEQLKVENYRRTRDAIRSAMIARSTALSNATNQGAQDTSGLAGGLSQISGMAANSVLAQNQNASFGLGLFQANRERMAAELSLSDARTNQQTGAGLFQLGQSLVMNSDKLDKIGSSLFNGSSSQAVKT